MLRLRFLGPISLVLLACADPPARVGATRDLSEPATAPAPRIPLVPVALKTQADFDALEARFTGHHDMGALLSTLELMAHSAKPAERPEDALLLMRLGMLYRDLDADARQQDPNAGYLQKALALGTRLRDEAPKSPHTLFLQGYIPFAFLGGAADRPMVVPADSREFASACRDQWKALLAADPAYDGPLTIDHDFIQRVIGQLDAALAQKAAMPPAAPVPAAALPRSDVEALNTMTRFEGATEGDRKGICGDWLRAKKPDAERSRPELDLDLACAISAGDAAAAVPLIVKLRDLEGEAFAPCLALDRLRDRADAARLATALQGANLDCQ